MDYNEMTKGNGVVLVEFFATWCSHCQHMMPIVEQIKALLKGKVAVYQLDIDKNADLAQKEGADSVPTFILYKDGTEQWRQSGELEAPVLLAKIESYL